MTLVPIVLARSRIELEAVTRGQGLRQACNTGRFHFLNNKPIFNCLDTEERGKRAGPLPEMETAHEIWSSFLFVLFLPLWSHSYFWGVLPGANDWHLK